MLHKWYRIKKIRITYRIQDRIQKMRMRRAVKALRRIEDNPWKAVLAFHRQSASSLEEAFASTEEDWTKLVANVNVRRQVIEAQRAYDARKAAKAAAKAAEEAA